MDQVVLDVGRRRRGPGAAGEGRRRGRPLRRRVGDGEPTAQDWAEAAGTISYEIVTRIGARVPRRYVGTAGRPGPRDRPAVVTMSHRSPRAPSPWPGRRWASAWPLRRSVRRSGWPPSGPRSGARCARPAPRRASPDRPTAAPALGSLRGTPHSVGTDDGALLYVEVDELALRPRPGTARAAARAEDVEICPPSCSATGLRCPWTPGTTSGPPCAGGIGWCCGTSAGTAVPPAGPAGLAVDRPDRRGPRRGDRGSRPDRAAGPAGALDGRHDDHGVGPAAAGPVRRAGDRRRADLDQRGRAGPRRLRIPGVRSAGDEGGPRGGPRSWPAARGWSPAAAGSAATSRACWSGATPSAPRSPPELVRFAAQMIASTSVPVLSQFLPALSAHDEREALSVLDGVETLVMVGDADLLTPPDQSRGDRAAAARGRARGRARRRPPAPARAPGGGHRACDRSHPAFAQGERDWPAPAGWPGAPQPRPRCGGSAGVTAPGPPDLPGQPAGTNCHRRRPSALRSAPARQVRHDGRRW